jgi:hypothetical protein
MPTQAQDLRHLDEELDKASPSPPRPNTPIGKEEVGGDVVTSHELRRVSSKRLYLLGLAILVLAAIAVGWSLS